jgi:uncharacterized circularly permuted ATP-grasp superfamily protein
MEIRSHSFVIHQSEWAAIEKGLIQRANFRFDLQGYLWGAAIN